MRKDYVDTRLGQLHCVSDGGEHKTPVLLLPQSGRGWSMFAGLIAELRDTYRLYAVDYPGHGMSDPLDPATSIEDIAECLVDFMDAVRIDRAHVYGLHGGNKIGTALVAAHPERIRKFVFAGQSHSIVPSHAQRLGTTGTARKKLFAQADEREAALVQWADLFSIISTNWWRESLMREIASLPARTGAIAKVVDELQAARCIRDFYAANRAYDLERDLKRIKVPTLILEIATPHEDLRVGRQGENLLKTISGSTLHTLEEEDFHGITLEDKPAQLAGILKSFFG